ncbi:hypothetical protein AJ79_05340 [Helicocarpus griseus UAMH5409]|uniref:gamma-glutamylcyclotransferase n=1 Tax=Helicocarpus griseus UAMH5409 TaxID=1447875 RepID=A0A2B7XN89_9EURO|nr:hypothetical protein AJ79_05340 [Helicocarpus griseus UAMH5409]
MVKLTEDDVEKKQPLLEPDTDTALESETTFARLVHLFISRKGKKHDPTLHIPQTSEKRLRSAAHDSALDVDTLLHDHGAKPKPTAKPILEKGAEETVLYLAYGSNMSAQTFRKTRGIVPVSQVSVSVPDLTLTFDLPGFPYMEPCFAGTKYRNHTPPDKTELPLGTTAGPAQHSREQKWPKPLVGIVYEVTLSDYARIIATEGGGASYIDVVVDCHPFPDTYDPADPVPSTPSTPPFKAHTLLSPSSSSPATSTDSKPNNNPRHTRPATDRPAQPSPRYKSLLITGAREHDLPTEYRAYLSSIPAYRITSTRQQVGKFVMLTVWAPPVLVLMLLGSLLADEKGRAPGWVAACQRRLFGGMWWWYDCFAKGMFGDGERTVEGRVGL